VDRIAEQWRELCAEGPSNEPFYRPEWIGAYIRAFAPDDKLLLITAGMNGRLKGLLPLLENRVLSYGVPLKKFRGAANVHSCRFDLIRGAGRDGDAAVMAIWDFLKNLSDWDLVELPDVPQGGSAEQLLWAAQKDGFPTGQWESMRSPYIVLAGRDPRERDARFRQNLRRRSRKATADRSMCLHRLDRADPNILQRFYDLESGGWKGKKGTAIASSEETRKFYSEIARAAEHFGYLSLYFLEFNNSTAAGHFGLTYGSRYYSVKVAYDETYKEYGPGHLLVGAILRDCLERGVSEFDFLGPWMEWKAKWAVQARPHAFCYIFRKGLLGRTLHAATQQGFKMTTVLKKAAQSSAFAVFRSYLAKKNSTLLPGRR
jgi:CelD/BcsL family acetyltransferase involved in cellulose biosynthesis